MTWIEWDGTINGAWSIPSSEVTAGSGRISPPALWPCCRSTGRFRESPIYHVRVDDQVVQAAERDLAGALRDLITAVLSQGEELLAASWLPRRNAAAGLPAERGRRSRTGHPATGRIRPVITARRLMRCLWRSHPPRRLASGCTAMSFSVNGAGAAALRT